MSKCFRIQRYLSRRDSQQSATKTSFPETEIKAAQCSRLARFVCMASTSIVFSLFLFRVACLIECCLCIIYKTDLASIDDRTDNVINRRQFVSLRKTGTSRRQHGVCCLKIIHVSL